MAQTKKAFDEVRIPLAKMSYTPDVPSAALGPNEYNAGLNIETDVRGVRSVAGESATLPDGVPGTIKHKTLQKHGQALCLSSIMKQILQHSGLK